MIDYETFVRIRNYVENDGLTVSQVADALALDVRTVARWANEKRFLLRQSPVRKSKLDPFKNDIVRMLEKHPYSAQQIFRRISENGFNGGVTIVEDYVRKARPPRTKAFLKLFFAPGECAQVDWGSFGTVRVGSTQRRLSFFVSKALIFPFTPSPFKEIDMHAHPHDLKSQLDSLTLPYIRENFESVGKTAAQKQWTHVHYLSELIHQETTLRKDRIIYNRIRMARFPVVKTLDQFNWSWPKKINQALIQNIFRLTFIEDKSNIVFIGGVGLGKTHLASALGYQACLKGHTVLFASAIDTITINTLIAAQQTGRLKQELKKYLKPSLLILDELGYLPIDKNGADLLFQVISQRYEQGSIVITGKSYRMKGVAEG